MRSDDAPDFQDAFAGVDGDDGGHGVVTAAVVVVVTAAAITMAAAVVVVVVTTAATAGTTAVEAEVEEAEVVVVANYGQLWPTMVPTFERVDSLPKQVVCRQAVVSRRLGGDGKR